MRTIAMTFYVLNLGVGVHQMFNPKPDPMVVLLAATGAGSAALMIALTL